MGKESNRCFLTKDIHLSQKHITTCSKALIIKERQIKTSMTYILILRRKKEKKKKKTKLKRKLKSTGQDCGEIGSLVHCCWENKIVQPLWKTVRVPQNLNTELPQDPAIANLGMQPKELKAGSQTAICMPMFTAALYTMTKRWKHSKCPSTGDRINKMWYTGQWMLRCSVVSDYLRPHGL